jgi:LysM repeat protein
MKSTVWGESHPTRIHIRVWFLRVINLVLLGMLSFSLPPLVLTVASYVYFQSADRIFPDVQVGDLDLGWMTIDEAVQLIDETWNIQDDITVFDLYEPERIWIDQASSFGVSVDAASTIQSAYEQGRMGGGLDSVWNMLSVLHVGASIDYHLSVDVSLAKSHLEKWAERANVPAQDEWIRVEGRTVIREPAQDGKSVDVLASLQLLIEDPQTLRIDHQMIPLVTIPIEAKRYATEEAVRTLERILDSRVKLEVYDPVTDEHLEWVPVETEIADWYEIQPMEDDLKVLLVHEAIQASIERFRETLGDERSFDLDQAFASMMMILSGREAEPLIIEYALSSYVVQSGDNLVSISFKIGMPYWKLYEVNPDLKRLGLVVGEELNVPPKDDMLELPVIPEKRIVISILEQRMFVQEHGEIIREHIVSTGIPSSPTLPGIFQINSHYENAYASIWDLTMPHFMGIYDAVPGLTNGIHGLPLLSSGYRLWADVLGNPASYGCIILDLDAAEELYYWAEEGVVVEIRE